jgi:hypothetical protein
MLAKGGTAAVYRYPGRQRSAPSPQARVRSASSSNAVAIKRLDIKCVDHVVLARVLVYLWSGSRLVVALALRQLLACQPATVSPASSGIDTSHE